MITVLDLAARAGVPVETVIDVLMRRPVREESRRAVADAVEELGLPDYPRPDDHVDVVAAELEPAEPHPVATGAQELVDELRSTLRELVDGFQRERRERIDDLELTTDLIAETWRNVDRRLGRVEKIVERLDRVEFFDGPGAGRTGEVRRLDDVRRPGA